VNESTKFWPRLAARLLWRVSSNLKLPVRQRLDNGSYLSCVYGSADRQSRSGQVVRIIEYNLTGAASAVQERYRLITNILQPEQSPGQERARDQAEIAASCGHSPPERLPDQPKPNLI